MAQPFGAGRLEPTVGTVRLDGLRVAIADWLATPATFLQCDIAATLSAAERHAARLGCLR
ncbi:MAG TPA: hypothetical protein VMV29_10665 [Ktedonobacterales bacterium]|nr:hypothetical protein [Ktedonobacterales bacterium]